MSVFHVAFTKSSCIVEVNERDDCILDDIRYTALTIAYFTYRLSLYIFELILIKIFIYVMLLLKRIGAHHLPGLRTYFLQQDNKT